MDQYNHKGPYKGKKEAGKCESEKETFEDSMLLALKMEERAMSQGMQAALGPMLYFRPPELKIKTLLI